MKKEVNEKRQLQEKAIRSKFNLEPYFNVTKELIIKEKIPP